MLFAWKCHALGKKSVSVISTLQAKENVFKFSKFHGTVLVYPELRDELRERTHGALFISFLVLPQRKSIPQSRMPYLAKNFLVFLTNSVVIARR